MYKRFFSCLLNKCAEMIQIQSEHFAHALTFVTLSVCFCYKISFVFICVGRGQRTRTRRKEQNIFRHSYLFSTNELPHHHFGTNIKHFDGDQFYNDFILLFHQCFLLVL